MSDHGVSTLTWRMHDAILKHACLLAHADGARTGISSEGSALAMSHSICQSLARVAAGLSSTIGESRAGRPRCACASGDGAPHGERGWPQVWPQYHPVVLSAAVWLSGALSR